MQIYMARAGDSGPVKIGVAKDARARVASLQTAHHERLSVVRIFRGDARAERWFHKRFEAERIRGEWFRWHPDMATAEPTDADLLSLDSGGTLLHHAPLCEAIAFSGSQAALAKRLGKTPAHIWFWLNEAKKFPPAMAVKVEHVTDGRVLRERLCPELAIGYQP